jgi:acetolactate synthase-1/2/3 large subunit
VAAVTAGPGVTNAVTGLWNALGKGSPIVVFGGRSPLREFEMGPLQDMDSLSLARTVTKWARSGYETRRIPEYVGMAFRQAMGGRPGPAYLEFPADILHAKVEGATVELPQNYRTSARPQGDPRLVREAVELLLGAKRPLVAVGNGVAWSDAIPELQEFLQLARIPCAGAPGVVPADMPYYQGLLYWRGSAVSTRDADVILLLGARLDFTKGYGREPTFHKDSKWIQVDIEATEIGRNRPIDVGIVGDVKAVLMQMMQTIRSGSRAGDTSAWLAECSAVAKARERELDELMGLDSVPIHPARLCREINDFLDRDATIIADGGDASLMAFRALRTYKPRHFLGVLPTGTLGIGTGYAMAAHLARPDEQVLLFSGDGSFGLNAMEFDTMVRHSLPVVAVICNDTAWGMMVRDQKRWGPDRIIGTELGFVRYDKMVEALGGYGEAVYEPAEIKPALERAFASGMPACINVRVAGPLDE